MSVGRMVFNVSLTITGDDNEIGKKKDRAHTDRRRHLCCDGLPRGGL